MVAVKVGARADAALEAGLGITVVTALAAAVLFGLCSVVEQRNTKQVAKRGALSPRLVLDLLKRPAFIAALALNAVGSLLQIVALHFGSLSVVQPLVVLNLLFAVVIAAVIVRRHRPDKIMLGGAVCCAAGVGCFLAIARPSGGSSTVGIGAALPLGSALAAALAAVLSAARWGPRRLRPLALALACGVDFGVNAFLLKIVPDMLHYGFAEPQRQWPLYMLVLVAPTGFLLNQSAFQAGTLIAPVLAVITTADPLVSIALGRLLLHETLASSGPAIAGQVASLAVMTTGIVALAHRAPQLAPPPGQLAPPPGQLARQEAWLARQEERHRDDAQGQPGPASRANRQR